MMRMQMLFVALGAVSLFAAYLGIVRGELKWNPDQPLPKAQARMVGAAALVIGLLMIAGGLFFPRPLWEQF